MAWFRLEQGEPTVWLNIVRHSDRVYGLSLTHSQRGAVVVHERVLLDDQTFHSLHDALGKLTHPKHGDDPAPFAQFGHVLWRLVLPERIQDELLRHTGPIVFATEELSLPWELLHTGRDFCCLVHPFARQPQMDQFVEALLGAAPDTSRTEATERALIVSDPAGDLESAAAEGEELESIFKERGFECDVLVGPMQCSFLNILAALSAHQYQIIHFCGHVTYLPESQTSAIRLAGDEVLSAPNICRVFKGQPFVFLNACHSFAMPVNHAAGDTSPDSPRLVRTLAQAFATGNGRGRARAVLGSMWWIDDKVAGGVAARFYQAVLNGAPLGESLRQARQHLSQQNAAPAYWSGYVLFGDPMLALAGATKSAATKPEDQMLAAAAVPPETAERPLAGTTQRKDVRQLSELQDGLPWSDDIRVALLGAMATMSMMNWRVFSTIHLLIGLTYLERGIVSRAFSAQKYEPGAARRALRKELRSEKDPGAEGFQISANLRAWLESAKKLARDRGDREVAEQHLVDALAALPDCGALLLLNGLGVVLQHHDSSAPAQKPLKPADKCEPAVTKGCDVALADLFAGNGYLNTNLFDADCLAALDEATQLALRTNWNDLRSPHLFFGIVTRKSSSLAVRLPEPVEVARAFLQVFSQPAGASMERPRLHREYISENSLKVLRAAQRLAKATGECQIGERHMWEAVLADPEGFVCQLLCNLKIDPAGLLD